MKAKIIHIVVTLLVLLFIGQLLPVQAGTGGVSWLPYDEGMTLGKSQKKKVFINFFATWCSFCKMMDTKTFKDAAVIDYLNANFITVKVDVDQERDVAAQYNISPLPDMWFISEKGEAIGNKPGYISAEEMLPVLKFIKTDSYLKMSYQAFLDSQP
ncbi:MAG: thioredoxin family protein [Thermodesulfobacteriota bacterium]